MKKTKVLFGTFAVLAALSLASCNNTPAEPNTATDTATVDESKIVTFNTMTGSVVESQTIVNGKITKPADPTKEGFAFAGWFADETCTVEFDFDGTYEESITAYAKWIKISTYHEFAAANVGDTVAVSGYIAAKQSYYKGGTLYIYAGEGVGFFTYQTTMTEEEYNSVYKVGKFVTVIGPKAEYAGEIEIGSSNSMISVNPYVSDKTDFVAVDLSDKIPEIWKYQNAYFKATLFVDEYVAGDTEAASANGAYGYNSAKVDATSGLPYDDLYFTLVDEDGNQLACCDEAYLDLDKSVRNIIMSEDFEVGAKVEVTGFLYWYNGANPHITSVVIKEAAPDLPDVYTAKFYIDADHTETINVEMDEDGFYMVNPPQNPANTEYATFDNWYADQACTIPFEFSEEITGNVEIWAKWNPITENVTYEFKSESIYTGSEVTYTEDTKVGAFTIGKGSLLRAESGKNYNSVNYSSGVKLQNGSIFTFNAAGAGYAELLCVDRGSLSAVTLTLPDGTTKDIAWAAGTTNGDADTAVTAKQMGIIKFDITEAGDYSISIKTGTPDISYAKMVCAVQKAPKTGITAEGAKADFLAGRTFEAGNLVVTLNYQNGRGDVLLSSDYTLDSSAVDFTKAGTYPVNITYGDFTTSYNVNVYEIDSLTAYDHTVTTGYYTLQLTKVFLKDATFNHNNLSVHATGKCGNETKDFLLTAAEFEVSTPDLTAVGEKTVTITAAGKETTYTIDVVENYIGSLASVEVFVDASATVEVTDSKQTFKTINQAIQYIDACNVQNNITKQITIATGTYFEKVQIAKPNYKLVGAGMNDTIIVFDAYNGKTDPSGTSTYSTIGSATLFVQKEATNLFVTNLQVQNWYNTLARYNDLKKITAGTQGDAVYCAADKAEFSNCLFSGYQDTLEAENGRQYYTNCIIEGHTDFIFGNTATAVFNKCEIRVIGMDTPQKNNGYIFVTKGSGVKYGYIVNDCDFTDDGNVNDGSVSLGRTWESAKTDKGMALIVMNSSIAGYMSKEAHGYDSSSDNELGNMNDRMTQMREGDAKYAIHPEQIVEFNNTGAGSITASIDGTCTVVTDPATSDYALVDKGAVTYADDYIAFLFEVFGPVNGDISYNDAWIPNLASATGTYAKDASVTLIDNKGNTIVELTNISYVGAELAQAQIKEYEEKDGWKFEGYFSDADCTVAYDWTTKLAAANNIYLAFSKLGSTVALGAYDGMQCDDTTLTGWTLSGEFNGTCNIAKVEGESTATTPAGGYDKVNKLDPGMATVITSPKFADSTQIDITISAASTATGNPVKVKIELLDAEGAVVKSVDQQVTTSKTRTTGTYTIESETTFAQVRISPIEKHIGIASITGTLYLAIKEADIVAYDGTTNDTTAIGWTLGGSFNGTCNIAKVEGESTATTPAGGTETVNKLDPGKSTTLTSVAFAASKKVALTITAASTATGNPVKVKIELLDAEGTVVKSVDQQVTTSKTRTTGTYEIESDVAFVQIRISPIEKHIGISSISGKVTLA